MLKGQSLQEHVLKLVHKGGGVRGDFYIEIVHEDYFVNLEEIQVINDPWHNTHKLAADSIEIEINSFANLLYHQHPALNQLHTSSKIPLSK